MTTILGKRSANITLGNLRWILSDVLHGTSEGAATIQCGLRAFDDFDRLQIEQLIGGKQRAAAELNTLARGVDTIDEHRHVDTAARWRQTANRDAVVRR